MIDHATPTMTARSALQAARPRPRLEHPQAHVPVTIVPGTSPARAARHRRRQARRAESRRARTRRVPGAAATRGRSDRGRRGGGRRDGRARDGGKARKPRAAKAGAETRRPATPSRRAARPSRAQAARHEGRRCRTAESETDETAEPEAAAPKAPRKKPARSPPNRRRCPPTMRRKKRQRRDWKGQKIHPGGFRIGISMTGSSNWSPRRSSGVPDRGRAHPDHIAGRLARGLSASHRKAPSAITSTLHPRPASCGKSGSEARRCARTCRDDAQAVHVNINEIKRPELDANWSRSPSRSSCDRSLRRA